MITDDELHYCTFSYPDIWVGLEGPSVESCMEDIDGTLWLTNGSFECSSIPVNYCPFCGHKAINQIESVK